MVAVVGAVGEDDVVEEADVEEFGCFGDFAGEGVVLRGWVEVAGGVVVEDEH